MPVFRVKLRPGIQNDFPVLADFLDRKDIPVVQAPPVRALTVSRDAETIAPRQLDLPFLKNLKPRRRVKGERYLPAGFRDRKHAALFVTTFDPEYFAALNAFRVLMELDDEPFAVILSTPPVRLFPLQIVKPRKALLGPQLLCLPPRLANCFRHLRALRMRRRYHQRHRTLAA